MIAWTLLLLGQLAAPGWIPELTLEVLNSRSVGRFLLSFEDLIGREAKRMGPHSPARALLIAATGDCRACKADADRLEQIQQRAAPLGGTVIALVLPTRPEDIARWRAAIPVASYPVVLDEFGFGKARLGLTLPRQSLVVRSDGRIIGRFELKDGGLTRAERVFLELLEDGTR